MAGTFTEVAGGARRVRTLRGDSLRRIALRELGNAASWVDLVRLNQLVPPYLVDDEADLAPGVLLAGSMLLVPAGGASIVETGTDAAAVFGVDCLLRDGLLVGQDGALALASGIANFSQSIQRRIEIQKQDLWFHPAYGCYAYTLKGSVTGQTACSLAEMYVKSALLEDDRVSAVEKITATIVSDHISVSAHVRPVAWQALPFSLVV